jgi:DNA-binding NarL/FixJ family response regulator
LLLKIRQACPQLPQLPSLRFYTHLAEVKRQQNLVDFSLPGMNGTELIRQLVRAHPDTPCLMVSSHHERFHVDAALAAGARGYVLKGEPDALLRAIAGVLRGEIVVET